MFSPRTGTMNRSERLAAALMLGWTLEPVMAPGTRSYPAAGRRASGLPSLRALALSCVALGLIGIPLRAQMSVNELVVTITPSANARVIATFVVRNTSAHATQAVITREDWDRGENGENRFVASGSTPNSCGALMSVFPIAFRIEPGAEETIRIAVEKASNPPKECWDIVFVQELPSSATPTRTGLQFTLRTGVKVYVVPTGLTRDASITNMTVEKVDGQTRSRGKDTLSPPAKQRIAIQFSNSGQVHLAATGLIEFRRLDNTVAMKTPIGEFPTLPGTLRRLGVDVPPTLPTGSYIALVLIDFGGTQVAAGQLELTVP
jgi:P pilus assembly chaperone PapD